MNRCGANGLVTVLVCLVGFGCTQDKTKSPTAEPQQEPAQLESLAPVESGEAEVAEEPALSEPTGQPLPEDSYAPEAPPQPRIHIVQPKDTLYGLARKYYHDERQWRRIWQANKQRVPNPDQIQVGMKLIIP